MLKTLSHNESDESVFEYVSLILVDNAVAENPANTTECIAPIRAQAKTEIANSGIIGRYIQTRSPFLIPCSFKTLAN